MSTVWPAKENNIYIVKMIVQDPDLPHVWKQVEIVLDANMVKAANSSEAVQGLLYFGFQKAIHGPEDGH